MPQLIAMVIVVVGAMIYMFQTFGGTGDKIEGIAQKTSVITEINNIKNGLKLAARAQHIADATATGSEAVTTLEGLAELAYFPEQVNQQLNLTGQVNTRRVYNAISFGANEGTTPNVFNSATNTSALQLVMVNNTPNAIPGIFVDLSRGSLASNAGFLESQIATDLASIATIDRTAITPAAGALRTGTTDAILLRTPADNAEAGTNNDGMFIIYFNDFGSNEVVINQ
jgi:hypothetical protein